MTGFESNKSETDTFNLELRYSPNLRDSFFLHFGHLHLTFLPVH